VDNLIDNPGSAAIHYGLQLSEWAIHPWVAGEIAIVGNEVSSGCSGRVRWRIASPCFPAIRGSRDIGVHACCE
jgi:hypothetical protein